MTKQYPLFNIGILDIYNVTLHTVDRNDINNETTKDYRMIYVRVQ